MVSISSALATGKFNQLRFRRILNLPVGQRIDGNYMYPNTSNLLLHLDRGKLAQF